MPNALERERTRKRRAAAKERGRKLVEAARARARKIIEAARARARLWLDVANRPRVRVVVKDAKRTAKRRTKATSAKSKGKSKPMTKASFAAQVLKIVRSKRPKKFGDKAYIASVWQVGFAADMTLGDFKKRIVAEHQAGRLELSRADLVAAMDQVQIERSETQHLNATFHFIRSEVSSKPVASKGTNTIEQAATFRKALGAVTAANPPGALLSVREVRARAGLPKAVFDALALNFASKNLVTLHHHDFPTSLSVTERAQLIEDDKGTFYIGIALRRPEGEISERTKEAMLDHRSEELILDEVRKMGSTNEKPVRIPALRKRLALLLKPSRFDKALGELQTARKVVLYRDDNNVTAETEGAYFVGGQPRHILYLR
jgi:hypothetical protein